MEISNVLGSIGDKEKVKLGKCEVCERLVLQITKHHLIPRAVHRKKKVKRMYDKRTLGKTIKLCQLCHVSIHQMFTEKQLGSIYNTKEKLLNAPGMWEYKEWAAKQHTEVR